MTIKRIDQDPRTPEQIAADLRMLALTEAHQTGPAVVLRDALEGLEFEVEAFEDDQTDSAIIDRATQQMVGVWSERMPQHEAEAVLLRCFRQRLGEMPDIMHEQILERAKLRCEDDHELRLFRQWLLDMGFTGPDAHGIYRHPKGVRCDLSTIQDLKVLHGVEALNELRYTIEQEMERIMDEGAPTKEPTERGLAKEVEVRP